jgi:nuclear mRNA export protein PCID2/THP1
VEKCLPEEDDVSDGKGSPWPGFNSFIKEYLEYWRDIDFNDPARVHARLSDLVMYAEHTHHRSGFKSVADK